MSDSVGSAIRIVVGNYFRVSKSDLCDASSYTPRRIKTIDAYYTNSGRETCW